MRYSKRTCILFAAAALTVAGCAADPYAPFGTTNPGPPYPGPSASYPGYPSYPNNEIARYGYVEAVETITPERSTAVAPGVGAIGGAIVGGVLGHQIGSGSGNTAATIGGAVVGGVAGHHVEQSVRGRQGVAVEYQFRVRMDDGSYQTFRKETHDGIRTGDRVKVERGNLFAL